MTNTTKEIVRLYDSLIPQASNKLGKRVKVEWGDWYPTDKGLSRLMARRNKLIKGA